MSPGDHIKRAVKKSGLTQQAFADELMVSIYTLRSWMRPPANRSYREPSPRNVRDAERLAAGAADRVPAAQGD